MKKILAGGSLSIENDNLAAAWPSTVAIPRKLAGLCS